MADSQPGRMIVRCTCGTKLAVRAATIEHVVKCPKCQTKLKVRPSASGAWHSSEQPIESDPGYEIPPESGTTESSESAADRSQPITCPNCRTAMLPEAVLCVACGYDKRSGRVLAPPPATAPAPERSKKSADSKPPIPIWAWLFAAACGIIPILTLGGAIPGAIGFGGAGGCIAVARNPTLPLIARLAICIAITILCWGSMVALFGGLALLQKK